MDPNATEVESIFAKAEGLPPADRAAYLQQACGDNLPLLQRVESLLASHDNAGSFLAISDPTGDQTVSPDSAPLLEAAGTMIGRYKLLQQIGVGGFGVVFMAEQEHPVRRKVALKIIKPGLDTKQVIARFEAERQALAMMDHPSIAKVFDAGATETGRSYFVMELVRGIPITEYCDQNQLTPRQRLGLFVQVCQAVQHAHQKGIIHRDLKPNNVLITLDDGDKPVPKVIDFGIAKATGDQRLTDRTLFTEFRQLIGTPLYMSPEQAEMSQLTDVDTRSDVYSLGVLLYELLTGTTPFDKHRLAKAAYDEVRRIIREEEPPLPSTRLSTLSQTLPAISSQRQTDAKKLSQAVRGELDWIVMKAMEKDRSRRYETANGLARDVERYLDDQPVEACPPSRMYRLRKFVRRNKAGLITVSLVVIALLAASVFSTWEALREKRATASAVREADHARSEAEKQRAVNDFLNTMLQSANPWTRTSSNPSSGKDVTVVQAIDRAVHKLDAGALRGHPEIESAVRRSIGITYQGLSRLDLAEVQFREALRLSRAAYGDEDPDVAQSMILLGGCELYQFRTGEAEQLLRGGVAMQQKFLGKSPVVADGMYRLSELLLRENKPVEAEKFAREALQVDPLNVLVLANALRDQGRFAEAEPLYFQTVNNDTQREGENSMAVQGDLYELGRLLETEQNFAEAEASFREAIAVSHARGIGDTGLRKMLAGILDKQSKYAEAEQVFREARQIDPHKTDFVFGMAYYLRRQSKNSEADQLVQEGMSLWEEQTKDRFAAADTPQKRAAIYLSLARELMYCGLFKEARDAFRKVLELGCDDANGLNEVAWELVNTPNPKFYDPTLAVQLAQKAVELAPGNGMIWNTLGVARYRAGDWQKAIETLQKSRELNKDGLFCDDAFFLAMCCWQLGQEKEARRWYDQAVLWMDKNQSKDDELRRFRAEAAELLRITAPRPSTDRATSPKAPSI